MPSLILPEVNETPAMAHPGQRHQLRGAEMFADLRGLSETRRGGVKVALEQQADGGGVAQISLFDAVQVAIVQQSLPPVDPPAAAGQLALVQQHEGRPERATGRTADVADQQALAMRTPPDIDGLLVPADEIGGHPQPLQILQVEPSLPIRRR